MDDSEARKAALKNALIHDGKANESSVFSKLAGTDKSVLKDVKGARRRIAEIVAEVNGMDIENQKKEAAELGVETETRKPVQEHGLKELPDVKGQVVLRLPPEPSGFMHLGHAIAGMINYLYREKYGGKLWLRFEDTNPNRVEDKFVESFRDGYSWLGIKWDEEKFISSDMDRIYDAGKALIESGKAYVCECKPEEIKKTRLEGKECEHRGHTIEENRHMWTFALEGKMAPGEAVVRFKGDMGDKDFSLRDPNIFRIVDTSYKPYALWPIYDFASVIEDDACGITHILRSNEFKVSFQDKLRDVMGLKKPVVVQFSRFNFKGTPFSKRKLRELIENKLINGWDDIRLPTVSAIRRRGITPEAIRDFVLDVGYTESRHEYGWDLLLTLNRRTIDERSKRYFFVSDPVKLSVTGAGERNARIPMHPSADLGFRSIKTDGSFLIDGKDSESLSKGSILRLKDLYTVEVENVGDSAVSAKFISDKMKGGEKIIQWVTGDNVPVEVKVVGQLLNDDGSFNEGSLRSVEGVAEKTVEMIKQGETVQFERFGFCILDNKEENSFVYISR